MPQGNTTLIAVQTTATTIVGIASVAIGGLIFNALIL